ncbi:GlxA family transcriptional regulator [Bacterioplanoides sp. SCSIO 12839]|uniref:GlxA family transcriptional regulator n=1 Tax=Bacterioplanoides sp. SCSIO 12839 TaxID=2829569 RepID=UPI002102AE61|nr:helix-turn-helix domain-containing protein [Bacterioplanoides sp. SCSIO 12839]UTW46951.1 helix-turn-helix domain-containing protein [Bacterioplanoides sp. SCSIO 12839]
MIEKIAVLAVNQMLMSSVAIPLEMLEACRARLRLARDPAMNFTVEVISQDKQPVNALGGILMSPNAAVSDLAGDELRPDLILVPALWRAPRAVIARNPDLIAWLARQYQAGSHIFAVGTGVCLLAEAGLLDGKPAVTHWHYLETFAQDYPRVNLQANYLLTQSDRMYCAASVNSGADMMIHILGLLFNRDLALQVEQQFSPEVRNPFEKKVFYADGRHQHGDEEIALVQTWMQHNLKEPLVLSKLAKMAGVGERQFDRRFKQVTGLAPGKYLQKIRCEQAHELLQNTNLSIADIAAAVGYLDSGYFIRIFRKHSGQTPGQLRQKVKSKLFTS